MLATWFSYNDLVELVKAVFRVPVLGAQLFMASQTTIENGRIMMLLSTLDGHRLTMQMIITKKYPRNGRASLHIR